MNITYLKNRAGLACALVLSLLGATSLAKGDITSGAIASNAGLTGLFDANGYSNNGMLYSYAKEAY